MTCKKLTFHEDSERRKQVLMCQPFVALPDLLTHSWQVFLKPRKIRDATVLALRVCKTRRTRACKADFPSGFLLACRSLRSKARRRRRTQDQYFSTGFKSGDLGGTCINSTLHCLYAFLESLASKKDSLTQTTTQGPFF